MDASYNQIPMHPCDEEKIVFVTPLANYCYKVMLFGLENVGSTYQYLMNKIFTEHIGKLLKVYVDDMLVKTSEFNQLISDLSTIFSCIRRHNIRLNPVKYAFTVKAGKFLGFMLTHRGIEVNPEKFQVILEMKSPTSVKDMPRLVGRLASLSHFLSSSARKSLPLFNILKKKARSLLDRRV